MSDRELIIANSVVVVVNRAAEEATCILLPSRAEQDTGSNYWWHGEDRWCRAANPAVSTVVLLAKP